MVGLEEDLDVVVDELDCFLIEWGESLVIVGNCKECLWWQWCWVWDMFCDMGIYDVMGVFDWFDQQVQGLGGYDDYDFDEFVGYCLGCYVFDCLFEEDDWYGYYGGEEYDDFYMDFVDYYDYWQFC